MTKRRVFVTYHHEDQTEVESFVRSFAAEFADLRIVGVTDGDDFINSDDADYILRRIREKYITGASATIALIGSCTWARRHVDWEIAATLRDNPTDPRRGLVAIQLESVDGQSVRRPDRIAANISRDANGNDVGYAAYHRYTSNGAAVARWIEEAVWRRDNRQPASGSTSDLKKNNSSC